MSELSVTELRSEDLPEWRDERVEWVKTEGGTEVVPVLKEPAGDYPDGSRAPLDLPASARPVHSSLCRPLTTGDCVAKLVFEQRENPLFRCCVTAERPGGAVVFEDDEFTQAYQMPIDDLTRVVEDLLAERSWVLRTDASHVNGAIDDVIVL